MVVEQVNVVEAAVTKELLRLKELHVYPFDELAAIRFEYEVLDKRRRGMIEK